MVVDVIKLGGKRRGRFMDKVMEILPEGGNLNLCLTCGACSSGCPATGLDGLDPRKFLRMAALGLDDEIMKSDWVWMCTMCQRCIYACPMKIDIPQLVSMRGPAGSGRSAPKASWDPVIWHSEMTAAVPWVHRRKILHLLWRMSWKSTGKHSPSLPVCRHQSTNRVHISF